MAHEPLSHRKFVFPFRNLMTLVDYKLFLKLVTRWPTTLRLTNCILPSSSLNRQKPCLSLFIIPNSMFCGKNSINTSHSLCAPAVPRLTPSVNKPLAVKNAKFINFWWVYIPMLCANSCCHISSWLTLVPWLSLSSGHPGWTGQICHSLLRLTAAEKRIWFICSSGLYSWSWSRQPNGRCLHSLQVKSSWCCHMFWTYWVPSLLAWQ